MRRRRYSKAVDAKRNINESGEVSHILQNYSGPSFSYLPRDILLNIMVRLSVKGILRCKFVCRTWYDLISDPEFAKLHFERSQVYPLIRFPSRPGDLYLLQPEKDEFNLKLDMCDHTGARLGCVCNVNVEIDTKFELPLYNYRIVNSSNGLLCLAGPKNGPLIVCNPVIEEFMKLPVPEANPKVICVSAHYGFGFSPASDKFKVIKMTNGGFRDDGKFGKGITAQVLTLGQELWKEIGFFLFKECERVPPTYLNGFLFWFSTVDPLDIFGFDIENELFVPVEAPPVRDTDYFDNNVGMGVLGEELCIIDTGEDTSISITIDVWVMKDWETKKEWSKVFSLELYSNLGCTGFGPYRPIKYMSNGALLMFQKFRNVLIYKDPSKQGFRCLKLPLSDRAEVIAHTPSFVSLKQAFSGQDANFLNVESRSTCGGCGIFIVEEEVVSDWEIGSDSEDGDNESDSEDNDLGSTEMNEIMELPTRKEADISAVKVLISLGVAVAGAAAISRIYLSWKK